ncbi:MAG: ABC transporter permease, partial [Chloroflexota bacterium]
QEMRRSRIRNVLNKEWRVLFTDVNSTLLVTLLPVLIVGQALLVIWLVAELGGQAATAVPLFVASMARLSSAVPGVAALPAVEQFQVLLLSQLPFYLLLIPTMVAISFATFSIVEEKTTRTLEPLLATPVRTWELLLGKALAGALPAVLVSWACASIAVAGVLGLGWGHLLSMLLTPTWYLSLCLLTPSVALLSFLLGNIGSSRARDAKGAQNTSLAIILPVLVLVGMQLTGVVWFSAAFTLVLALGVGLVDVVTLRIATRLFQRESIVVNWR